MVLASATPSLETLTNARAGRYRHVKLTARHGVAVLPDIRLLDMRTDGPERGRWLSPTLVKAAGDELVVLYSQNVFPAMKVTWGTHPNHIGHMSYPGCFRCHDGEHAATGGASITQDCAACHNLLATDEPKPKVLSDLGIQ